MITKTEFCNLVREMVAISKAKDEIMDRVDGIIHVDFFYEYDYRSVALKALSYAVGSKTFFFVDWFDVFVDGNIFIFDEDGNHYEFENPEDFYDYIVSTKGE